MRSSLINLTSCTFVLLICSCMQLIQRTSATTTDEERASTKNKREAAGGPSGLFPFPRIGRSGPDTWFMDAAGKQLFQEGGLFFNRPEISNFENKKPNQDNIAEITGLHAFPRVGRSNYDKKQHNDINGLIKRQGLVPFPRVGRSGNNKQNNVGSNNPNGLWFGPRLGRTQKSDPTYDSPWALVTLRDFPTLSSRSRQPEAFTPRLGRESNEDFSEDYTNNDHQRTIDDRASRQI